MGWVGFGGLRVYGSVIANPNQLRKSSSVVCLCVSSNVLSNLWLRKCGQASRPDILWPPRTSQTHLGFRTFTPFQFTCSHFPTSKNTWINKIRNLKRSGVEVRSVVALATGKACCNNTVRQNCPTCTFAQLHICTSASCLQCSPVQLHKLKPPAELHKHRQLLPAHAARQWRKHMLNMLPKCWFKCASQIIARKSSQDVVANFKSIDSDRQQKQECVWSEAEEEGQGVHRLGGQRGAFHFYAFIQISFHTKTSKQALFFLCFPANDNLACQ